MVADYHNLICQWNPYQIVELISHFHLSMKLYKEGLQIQTTHG